MENQNNIDEHKNKIGEQNTKNPLMIYLAIGVVVFLIIVGLFLNFFSSSGKDTETPEKQSMSFETKNKDFIDLALSVEDKKEENGIQELEKKFDENPISNPCDTCKNFMGKEWENCMLQNNCSSPVIKQAYNKPKIYKMGSIMVASNSNGNGNSNSNNEANSNLTLQESPQTLFEFGQNGAVSLNQSSTGGNSFNGDRGESSNGEIYTPTAAKFSPFNQSLLLPKGTYIGCSLKTRLVSEIRGGIACIVSNNVYSANGHALLIEKGSLVSGTYTNEGINDGSNRIYVIWQEIRTPNNIVIPIFSGASDSLGGAGMEGYVDHHYLKRFGAAILVSMIDDVMGAIANRISQKSDNYYDYSQNTREGANELANEVLKRMIDIKPTLYKNHGDLVGIYVNKDVDFSKVYHLRSKRVTNE